MVPGHTAKLRILMLLGILALSIIGIYVPHHHHDDGRFCVEQDGGEATHNSEHDECLVDNFDLNFKGTTSSITTDLYPSPFLLALAQASFPETAISLPVFNSFPAGKVECDYKTSSQKLRGSPIFS